MKQSNRTRGHMNKKAGDGFEQLVEAASMAYRGRGVDVWRNNPQVVTFGKGGKITGGFYKGKAALDYSGFMADNRYFEFECKETCNDRLSSGAFTDGQRERIEMLVSRSKCVFVVCQLDDGY